MKIDFQKLKKILLWLVFTNRCKYCNTLIKNGEEVCEQCRENLPEIKGEKCKYCGAEKKRCNCKKHRTEYDGITAPFYYEDSIALAVRRFKFYGKDFLADILAEKMAECVKTDFKDIEFDFICYIPFTTSQKIQRKYNQSELLAEKLSEKLNIPLSNILVKLFDTNSQHKMNLKYRAGNVFGVYDVNEKVDVTGKTILLVDDVRTTGATLNDSARILKIRGADKVYCTIIAVAGAKSKDDNNESEKLK